MPRNWDQAYKEGNIPWDKGRASPPLLEFLEDHPITGSVLVPGCGRGHDVRLLAAQGAEVVGLDIAPNALREAESFPRVSNERYVLGDFLHPEYKYLPAFDWLVEHTCLCAIEPNERSAYVRALKRVLKPRGYYLAVHFRKVRDYSGESPPHPVSKEETDRLFSDFELLDSFIPQKTYEDRPIGAEEVCWMRLSCSRA